MEGRRLCVVTGLCGAVVSLVESLSDPFRVAVE
jgi:hypothetical protein